MQPVTRAEVYAFYNLHKANYPNRNQLIKGFLTETLGISTQNISGENTSVFERQIDKLVEKLKWILAYVKRNKKKQELEDTLFMTEEESKSLIKLCGYDSTRMEVDASSEESDRENDNNPNNAFYKPFGELTSQRQRLRRTKEIVTELENWVEREGYQIEKLIGFIGYTHCY